MKNLVIAAIVVASIAGCASEPAGNAKQSTSIDERLVGEWQGQRDAEGKCTFIAWKMIRASDGNFSVTFFTDTAKSKVDAKESGQWWTDNNKLYVKTLGVPTPDIYTYSFINQSSIRFVSVQRDPSAECQADYEFTDNKVSK